MDETIGVKGGHNDRRKVLINIKNKKNKELEELEKDVKRKQKYTKIIKQNIPQHNPLTHHHHQQLQQTLNHKLPFSHHLLHI